MDPCALRLTIYRHSPAGLAGQAPPARSSHQDQTPPVIRTQGHPAVHAAANPPACGRTLTAAPAALHALVWQRRCLCCCARCPSCTRMAHSTAYSSARSVRFVSVCPGLAWSQSQLRRCSLFQPEERVLLPLLGSKENGCAEYHHGIKDDARHNGDNTYPDIPSNCEARC